MEILVNIGKYDETLIGASVMVYIQKITPPPIWQGVSPPPPLPLGAPLPTANFRLKIFPCRHGTAVGLPLLTRVKSRYCDNDDDDI